MAESPLEKLLRETTVLNARVTVRSTLKEYGFPTQVILWTNQLKKRFVTIVEENVTLKGRLLAYFVIAEEEYMEWQKKFYQPEGDWF